MDRYVVIGNPISHSLSPRIHARFAAAEGEAIDYRTMLVEPGAFETNAREFFAAGGRGANVTLPFKLEAFDYAGTRSERALAAGAANFLMATPRGIHADNTDGAGLVADLARNLGLALSGTRVLILGAGGAARGVIAPLLALSPAAIVIANRTVARAQDLAARFGARVSAVSLDGVPATPFDLVVNATSSSTRGEALDLPRHAFGVSTFAYDMAYGANAAAFIEQASRLGARASDGLGMLVEQAAESYFLWRGRRPATRAVIDELRAASRGRG